MSSEVEEAMKAVADHMKRSLDHYVGTHGTREGIAVLESAIQSSVEMLTRNTEASPEGAEALVQLLRLFWLPTDIRKSPKEILSEVPDRFLDYLVEETDLGKYPGPGQLIVLEWQTRHGHVESWSWEWDPSNRSGQAAVLLKHPIKFVRVDLVLGK